MKFVGSFFTQSIQVYYRNISQTAYTCDILPLMANKLTPQQETFVHAYMSCSNATQAALEAGYSPKSAAAQGCMLLKSPKILAELSSLRQSVKSDAIATYTEVCERLTNIIRANVGDYLVNDEINLVRVQDHCPDAVHTFEQRVGMDGETPMRISKFRLHDPIRAIERLSKLKGWDQPPKIQVENVTQPSYNLSTLSDEELAAFEALLEKTQNG